MMRTTLFAATVALLALSGCGGPTANGGLVGNQPAAPASATFGSIVAKPASADLGTVINEAVTVLKFELTNTGKKDVKLVSAETSCGCYEIQIPAKIGPGQTVAIEAPIQASMDWAGPHDDAVTVQTDDPAARSVVIKFHAIYSPGVAFTPESPNRVKFTPGKPLSIPLKLRARKGAVGGVEINPPNPAFTLEKHPAPDGSTDVVVKSVGAQPPGVFQVKLRAEAPAVSRYQLYTIYGQPNSGPVADPSIIDVPFLTASSKRAPLSQLNVVDAANPSGGGVKILSVKSSDPAISCVFGPNAINVFYIGGWKAGGEKRATITIKTNHKKFPTLTVPVWVRYIS